MSFPDNSNQEARGNGQPFGSSPYGAPSPFGPAASGDQFLPLPYENGTPGSPQYGPAYGAQGYGAQGYGSQGYGAQGYGAQGYAVPGYGFHAGYPGAPDPMAPFGRDPYTGERLSNRSKVAAGLLQLFLGSFGAGRFYLGYTGIGAAQLVLTVVGWVTMFMFIGIFILPAVGIWAFVDAIMIFTGSVRDSNGYKLQP